MDNQLNALRDTQPPDLAEAEAEDRLALLDYDPVDWSLAANTSIRHDRVVRFMFDRILATMPSRTWGRTSEDHVRNNIYRSRVAQPHDYDTLDWAYATLMATSCGRVNKHVFDMVISHFRRGTYRWMPTDETEVVNNTRPQDPQSPRIPELPGPLMMLRHAAPARRATHHPVAPANRHFVQMADIHSPPPIQLPHARSPSRPSSPPPRYTSHPPGPQAPPPRYTSRPPERTQRLPPERPQRRASPQPGHGRDHVRSRSPIRRHVEYYPDHVVPVTRNGQRFLIRRSVASQQRIDRERNRAAARRD
ncbi:hypothetical protein KCU67_g2842, partial [Aureobasidium melanogenum]